MNRKDLLDMINEKLEEEHATTTIEEDDTLVSSGVDSFGLTMVLVDIANEYGIYPKEQFANLDFPNLTAKQVIDDIMDKHENN